MIRMHEESKGAGVRELLKRTLDYSRTRAKVWYVPVTVEARIRSWEAVRLHAIRTSNLEVARTAGSLQTAYDEARQARQPAERPPQHDEGSFGRRGRLPPAS
jgi:hypothetical protein